MIESHFKELHSISNDGSAATDERDETATDLLRLSDAETAVLSALFAVEKIVRRKTVFSRRSDAADLVQIVALRLWRWRDSFRDKSEKMSPDEWQAFAARAAYNEINRHFSTGAFLKEVPLEEASEIASEKSIAGDSNAEVSSLLRAVWQEICRLSLRQRRALLLQSQQLIVRLLDTGIGDEELARVLEFGADEWTEVKIRLPLSDAQIARLAIENGSKNRNVESLTKSVKKARYEARGRLQKFLEGR